MGTETNVCGGLQRLLPPAHMYEAISAPFSKAHLLVMAAFLVCTRGWSVAHCLAGCCRSVCSSPGISYVAS